MKSVTAAFILLLISAFPVLPQGNISGDRDKVERLEKIYRSLEYNTASFNDLKRTWIVTDPVFVREIFNKFIVKNALRIHGKKPTVKDIEENAQSIYDGDIFIDLRKRYYDDEIELLRFFKESRHPGEDTAQYFFDEISDCILIRETVGEELYSDLKKQWYALNDITKSYYDYKPAYNFESYFNITRPEIMFWSATTATRNKYLLSVIGRWGNEHVTLPGWYHPDYIVGFKLNYVDSLASNKQGYSYIGEAGIGIPAVQPDLGFDNSFGRKLESSGNSFYFKFQGSPLKYLLPEYGDIELDLTGYVTLGARKIEDYKITAPYSFYSNRSYIDLFFRWNNLGRLSDFGTLSGGVGYAAFDVKGYIANPALKTVVGTSLPEADGFRHSLVAEGGVGNVGSILSHNIGFMLNYNFTESSVYMGVKLKMLFNNSFGFDFSVLSPMKTAAKGLPAYREDSYFIISPVIRINY